MASGWILAAVLLPIAVGIIVLQLHEKAERLILGITGAGTVLTSLLAWILILRGTTGSVSFLHFTGSLSLHLQIDGAGRFFAGIVATLWPLTVLYASSYMQGDERLNRFYGFFTIAYGVTLGIAFSGNLFTLYCFYEMLTLSTIPLVMHPMTREADQAALTYFELSLGGAALAFVSMMYLMMHDGAVPGNATTQLFYLLGFFGFGVKAAVFPLHFWLPRASVAPTPVTALLHAAAVVTAGVFAILRLTWYGYGVENLRNSFAQVIALGFAIFTVLYGAVKAVRERHWKRRLAYSTIANLSYMLFGILLLTEEGLTGGLLHMAFHSGIKILAFFAAGAVLHVSGREYVTEMDGLARRMPVTFACYMAAALALTGIPPFAGFFSKWNLLTAATAAFTTGTTSRVAETAAGDVLSFVVTIEAGIGVLTILAAALLTAIYSMSVAIRALFPDRDADLSGLDQIHEADFRMLIPLVMLAVGILVTGLLGGQIRTVIETIRPDTALSVLNSLPKG